MLGGTSLQLVVRRRREEALLPCMATAVWDRSGRSWRIRAGETIMLCLKLTLSITSLGEDSNHKARPGNAVDQYLSSVPWFDASGKLLPWFDASGKLQNTQQRRSLAALCKSDRQRWTWIKTSSDISNRHQLLETSTMRLCLFMLCCKMQMGAASLRGRASENDTKTG